MSSTAEPAVHSDQQASADPYVLDRQDPGAAQGVPSESPVPRPRHDHQCCRGRLSSVAPRLLPSFPWFTCSALRIRPF